MKNIGRSIVVVELNLTGVRWFFGSSRNSIFEVFKKRFEQECTLRNLSEKTPKSYCGTSTTTNKLPGNSHSITFLKGLTLGRLLP